MEVQEIKLVSAEEILEKSRAAADKKYMQDLKSVMQNIEHTSSNENLTYTSTNIHYLNSQKISNILKKLGYSIKYVEQTGEMLVSWYG